MRSCDSCAASHLLLHAISANLNNKPEWSTSAGNGDQISQSGAVLEENNESILYFRVLKRLPRLIEVCILGRVEDSFVRCDKGVEECDPSDFSDLR